MTTTDAATPTSPIGNDGPASGANRTLTYAEAIREATEQEMARERSVLLFGILGEDSDPSPVPAPGLAGKPDPDRVFDIPFTDDGMLTGLSVGMALAGVRPLHVYRRTDHLIRAMDQLAVAAAKVRTVFAGRTSFPFVVRAVIDRSRDEGTGFSRALPASFAHIPGIKIVAPTTPYDAKGALIAALRSGEPVLFLEHRELYAQTGVVPKAVYTIPLGNARVLAEGAEVTLVGISPMTVACLRARDLLAEAGISCEVVDALSLHPLDAETIAASVEKTGRLLVVDDGRTDCGAGAELLARMRERFEGREAVALRRIGFRGASSGALRGQVHEASDAAHIASRAYAIVTHDPSVWSPAPTEVSEPLRFGAPA